MAGKLATEGIRVTVLFPGGINKYLKRLVIEENARRMGEDPKAAVDAAAQSGVGEPLGMAKVLAFLVSDEADYVRGSVSTR